MGLADEVAATALAVDWDGLPASTKAAAERCVLHVLGTAYLGQDHPISRSVIEQCAEAGTATVVGLGKRTTPIEAAFANATAAHADFRDDAHSASQSHPGVSVIPAALAAAEAVGAGGAGFGSAVVAGYQIIGRLGRLGAAGSTPRGFRASAIYSVFGAAVAAARMLGLDRERTAAAVALAAHGASGLNEPFLDGTDDWILLPGLAARNGLSAALLARAGVPGSPRILEGANGFFRAYADREVSQLDSPGAPDWEIEVTRLKSGLTCGWNQATAHLLSTRVADLKTVRSVRITVSPEAHEFPGVVNAGPFPSYTTAVLSLPFAVASLTTRGTLEPADYRDLNDPAVLAAAGRVVIEADPEYHGYDTRVDVTHSEGTETFRLPGDAPQWLLDYDSVRDRLAAKLNPDRVAALAELVPAALAGAPIANLLAEFGRQTG